MTNELENVRMPTDPKTLLIMLQLTGAFWHGAGGLSVEEQAVAEMTRDYVPAIQERRDAWPGIALNVIELGRAMGRLAAGSALQHGRAFVASADYRAARDSIASRDNLGEFLAECPFCLGPSSGW
jgi:hypothetical protein